MLYEKAKFRATQLISMQNANKCNKYSKDKSDIKVLYWLFKFKPPMTRKNGTRDPFLSLDLIFICTSVSFCYVNVTRCYMRVVLNCIFIQISNLQLERLLHLALLYVQQWAGVVQSAEWQAGRLKNRGSVSGRGKRLLRGLLNLLLNGNRSRFSRG